MPIRFCWVLRDILSVVHDSAHFSEEDKMKMTKKADPASRRYEELHDFLRDSPTRNILVQRLQQIAPEALRLDGEQLGDLRSQAKVMLESFTHRIKTEELDRRAIRITRAKYIDTKFGGTYMLSGSWLDDPSKGAEWDCWLPGSEGGQTYRFFTRRQRTDYPVDVMFTREPHEFTNTAGKREMGSRWTVERIPDGVEAFKEIPF
jgi:hypothetical protein